jgi:hypothetical protein
MNKEEKITNKFLNEQWKDVLFEPDGNVSPDFLVDSIYAIEVRRLNEHYFDGSESESLEIDAFPLFDAFHEVLRSFDNQFIGQTYRISIEFHRPLGKTIKLIKVDMKTALREFLDSSFDLPCKLVVNENVDFYIYPSITKEDQLFTQEGSRDTDSGGFVSSLYINNILHCIAEKSIKIESFIDRYHKWWLILVDSMEYGLDQDDSIEIISAIEDIANFDKVLVIDREGKKILEFTSR